MTSLVTGLRFELFLGGKKEAQNALVALNRISSCCDYCNRTHVLGKDKTVAVGLRKRRNHIGAGETISDDDQHCFRREVDHRRVAWMKHRLQLGCYCL